VKVTEGAIARVLSFEGELDDEQRARPEDIAERTPVGARSFEHFDTITVSMPDAPKLDEIVVAARISGR